MYRLAVRFGDNDFWQVVKSFMEQIREHYIDDGRIQQLSKKDVAELFNLSAHGLYWLCQNRLAFRQKGDDKLPEYLKITEDKVYFDKEVDQVINSGLCDGDAYALDLHTKYLSCH